MKATNNAHSLLIILPTQLKHDYARLVLYSSEEAIEIQQKKMFNKIRKVSTEEDEIQQNKKSLDRRREVQRKERSNTRRGPTEGLTEKSNNRISTAEEDKRRRGPIG